MKPDSFFLQRCQVLAEQAALKGNSPVGALLVLGNTIVSEAEEAAHSKQDITCHAEMEAIRAASRLDLSRCVLYSTHEPCVMCAYAIRYYQISKVVFQHRSAYLGGTSSAFPVLTTAQVPAHWGKAPEICCIPLK